MICRIFGVFTVKIQGYGKVHFMLMENTLRIEDTEMIQYVFDLKGSTVDRFTKGSTKQSTVLKDMNLIHALRKEPDLVKIKDETKEKIRNQFW